MRVLAIDTALDACQAAVVEDGRPLAARSEPMQRGHQERLAPIVRDAMAEAAVGFETLDRIAVTVGPGSFTGLRVGLAFAKGAALALGAPCMGVGTLEALAASAPRAGLTVAAIDARREHVHFQLFRDGRALDGPAYAPLTSAELEVVAAPLSGEEVRLVGPGAHLLSGAAPESWNMSLYWPDPLAIARLATAMPFPLAPPEPLYLRGADALTIAERAARR